MKKRLGVIVGVVGILLFMFSVNADAVGLVSWWKMDETIGSWDGTPGEVTDSHGTNEGTASGANTVAGGKSGNCGFLDGGDYLDTSDPFQSVFQSSYTIEAWIKPDDGHPAVLEPIISTTYPWTGWITLRLNTSGTIYAVHGMNSGGTLKFEVSTSSAVFSDGGGQSWKHVACVLDASAPSLTIYVDGSSAGTSSSPDAGWAASGYRNNTYNVYIGSRNEGGDPTLEYNGLIDEVRIWDVALTQPQIQWLHDHPGQVPEPSALLLFGGGLLSLLVFSRRKFSG